MWRQGIGRVGGGSVGDDLSGEWASNTQIWLTLETEVLTGADLKMVRMGEQLVY